ncbi:MAG TPA: beta-ketoacyl synthase N-terminal-like domain-containing protein [Terracidiphilus sp.]
MKTNLQVITGIGSVTAYGPLAGLIPAESLVASLEPRAITAWRTRGLRRAFLVEPFRPASIVPGLKTRRLDSLSAWALVASSLALRDANIDLGPMDRSRIAVLFATGFGCVELTLAFYQSAAANGWAGTDPITFPETLHNAPASHVALFHDLRGPNVTISSKNFAAESALLQAASMLRHGQADLAIVLAGDTLTQAVYEWYEVAQLLAPACFNQEPISSAPGFVPSEGVVAMVLEPPGCQAARSYAALGAGCWAAGGDTLAGVRKLLGDLQPDLTICSGNGTPCASRPMINSARKLFGEDATIYPAQPVAAGMGEAGALFHLLLALSKRPGSGQALLLGTSAHGGYAALRLELF